MTNDVQDYNPHQYSFEVARLEGITEGRRLMKKDVLKILSKMNMTKSISRIVALIKEIEA